MAVVGVWVLAWEGDPCGAGGNSAFWWRNWEIVRRSPIILRGRVGALAPKLTGRRTAAIGALATSAILAAEWGGLERTSQRRCWCGVCLRYEPQVTLYQTPLWVCGWWKGRGGLSNMHCRSLWLDWASSRLGLGHDHDHSVGAAAYPGEGDDGQATWGQEWTRERWGGEGHKPPPLSGRALRRGQT